MKTKNINTAEYYCLQGENQFFDRKSARIIRWPHKVGPNTRVRTKLALVFFCPFLPLGLGNFYAAFFFLYSTGDKYPNFSFILSSL